MITYFLNLVNAHSLSNKGRQLGFKAISFSGYAHGLPQDTENNWITAKFFLSFCQQFNVSIFFLF